MNAMTPWLVLMGLGGCSEEISEPDVAPALTVIFSHHVDGEIEPCG